MISPQLIICLIGCLDFTAVSMLMPLISSHIIELGASPSITGVISSMYGGVQLVSSPIMGSWSDKSGRKLSLLISLLGASIGYVLIGASNLISLFILARMFLALFKHTQTMCRAYLADLTPSTERSKVFGLFNSSSSVGFILGPIIGGHIGELNNGFFIVCVVSSIIFIINSVIVQTILPDLKPTKQKESEFKGTLKSLSEISWKNYWQFFLLKFLLTFAVILYRSNNTLIMKETLNLTKTQLGYVVSFQGGVTTIAGFCMGHVTKFYNYQHRKLLFHAIFLQGLSFISLTFANSLTHVLISLLFLCLSNTTCRIGITKLIVDKTKNDHFGAVMGVSQSITSVSRTIAPICAGILQEIALWGPNFAATTGSICAFILLTMLVAKDNRINSEITRKKSL